MHRSKDRRTHSLYNVKNIKDLPILKAVTCTGSTQDVMSTVSMKLLNPGVKEEEACRGHQTRDSKSGF
jgi:hypothetical protein